jgi:hypothetical protein
MSCDECEIYQDGMTIAYYRWGKANIGILACPKHATEIISALNKAQGIGGSNPIKEAEK